MSALNAAPTLGDGRVKLVAKSIVKFGGRAELNGEGAPTGRWITAPTYVQPGETFAADRDTAEKFILMGVATTPFEYLLEQRMAETADETQEEKRSRLRRELAEAEDPGAPEGRTHDLSGRPR